MAEKGFAEVKGVYTPYAVFGKGNRNLVILPGVSVTPVVDMAQIVERYFSDFHDDYRLWIIDRRTALDENCTVEMMAEDAAEVMIRLGIHKACIYGTSQGGMMSLSLAAAYPQLVEKVFVAAASAGFNKKSEEILLKWIELAESGKRKELAENFMSLLYTRKTYDSIINSQLLAADKWTVEQLHHFTVQCRAAINPDVFKVLEHIRCPVCVAGCEGDRVLFPEGSREIADALGCSLYMYGPEYEHGVFDEAPDFLKKVKNFFDN